MGRGTGRARVRRKSQAALATPVRPIMWGSRARQSGLGRELQIRPNRLLRQTSGRSRIVEKKTLERCGRT